MIYTVPVTFNGLVKFADKAVFDSEATFNDSIHTEGDHTISGNLEVGKDAEVDGKLTLNTLGDLKTKDESFLAETSEDNGKIIHEVGLKDVGTTISANSDQSEVTWSVNNAILSISAKYIHLLNLTNFSASSYPHNTMTLFRMQMLSSDTIGTDSLYAYNHLYSQYAIYVGIQMPGATPQAHTCYNVNEIIMRNKLGNIITTLDFPRNKSGEQTFAMLSDIPSLDEYAKTADIASTYATKDDLTNKIADVTAITNELDSKIETNYNSINNLTSHAITATATDIKATLVFTIINVVNKSYAGTVLIDILKDLFNTYAKAGNKLPYVISCSGVFIGSEIIFITSITLPEDFADSGMITITGYNPSGAEVTQTVSAAVFTSVTDTISFPTVG